MTLLLALLLSAPAQAKGYWSQGMSLHLQGGGVPVSDQGLGSLYNELPRDAGLRYGYSLSTNLELVATVNGSTRSSNLRTGDVESLGARLNTFSYGAGARIVGDSTFHPYAAAQLRLFQAGLRLDGDRGQDDNLDFSVSRSFSPGATGSLGLELRPQPDWSVAPSIFVEGGYTWTMRADLGDLGQAQFKGLSAQAGIGVRF